MASSKDNLLEIPYYKIPPTYEEFLTNHLIPHKPCIIGPSLTRDWKANKEWIVPINALGQEPKYKPNYEHLRKEYGAIRTLVTRCDKLQVPGQDYRTKMSFADFSLKWEKDDGKSSLYYLKSFRLKRKFPNDEFYTVPTLFEDDWLNEYWLQQGYDDYRLVYFGGHTTFTPIHADAYRSYAWSSNICGIKKWTMFPPGQEDLYKDKFSKYVYDVRDVDPTRFTKFENAKKIVIFQKAGETVFVPSNWYHQVENVGATISINHIWINASNIMSAYERLRQNWIYCKAVKKYFQHKMSAVEFLQECQKKLLVDYHWDWGRFLGMMAHVVSNRIKAPNVPKHQPNLTWQMNRIQDVLTRWENDEPHLLDYFKKNNLFTTYSQLKSNMSTLKMQ